MYSEHVNFGSLQIGVFLEDGDEITPSNVLEALSNSIDFAVYPYGDIPFGESVAWGNDYAVYYFETDITVYILRPEHFQDLRKYGNCVISPIMF